LTRLRFRDPADPGAWNELLLDPERRTVRFVPAPRLQADLERTADAAEETAQKWGASLLMGLATVGATLYLRGRRGGGYAAFTAAGLAGVGGWGVRRAVRAAILPNDGLLGPLPLDQVTVEPDPSTGGMTFILDGGGGGLRKMTVTLGPGEYDALEADAFLRALIAAKNQSGSGG
jgi:hypothetical protein